MSPKKCHLTISENIPKPRNKFGNFFNCTDTPNPWPKHMWVWCKFSRASLHNIQHLFRGFGIFSEIVRVTLFWGHTVKRSSIMEQFPPSWRTFQLYFKFSLYIFCTLICKKVIHSILPNKAISCNCVHILFILKMINKCLRQFRHSDWLKLIKTSCQGGSLENVVGHTIWAIQSEVVVIHHAWLCSIFKYIQACFCFVFLKFMFGNKSLMLGLNCMIKTCGIVATADKGRRLWLGIALAWPRPPYPASNLYS